NTGLFVQVFDEPGEDRPVPGEPFTFGRLFAAQAAGDLAALREGGRRVARVAMEDLLAWDGSAPLGLTEGDPEKEEG
ncbi:MAG: hypothetical protein ACRDH1_14565, partial [Actinomycetota bacterium]